MLKSWPEPLGFDVDPAGLTIRDIAAALRRYKAERGMALNAPLPGITVYSDIALETVDLRRGQQPCGEPHGQPGDRDEACGGCQAADEDHRAALQGQERQNNQALSGMDPVAVACQKAGGSIRIEVDGEDFDLPPDAAEIAVETHSAGAAVDVLRLERAVVLIKR